MGHDGTQFLHSGLRCPGDHHQSRARQQCLLQGQNNEHGASQTWSVTAVVWRVPHAAGCLCVSGRHLGELPPYEETYLSAPMDAPMQAAGPISIRWTLAAQLAFAAALLREASNVANLSSRLVREACAISCCLSGRNIGLFTHQSMPISLALSTEQMTSRI